MNWNKQILFEMCKPWPVGYFFDISADGGFLSFFVNTARPLDGKSVIDKNEYRIHMSLFLNTKFVALLKWNMCGETGIGWKIKCKK